MKEFLHWVLFLSECWALTASLFILFANWTPYLDPREKNVKAEPWLTTTILSTFLLALLGGAGAVAWLGVRMATGHPVPVPPPSFLAFVLAAKVAILIGAALGLGVGLAYAAIAKIFLTVVNDSGSVAQAHRRRCGPLSRGVHRLHLWSLELNPCPRRFVCL